MKPYHTTEWLMETIIRQQIVGTLPRDTGMLIKFGLKLFNNFFSQEQ